MPFSLSLYHTLFYFCKRFFINFYIFLCSSPFFVFFQIFLPTPAFPPHFALPNSKIKKNGYNPHSLPHSRHPAKHLCHLFRKIRLLRPIIALISRSCKKLTTPTYSNCRKTFFYSQLQTTPSIPPFLIFSAMSRGNHYIHSIDILPAPML